jgi:uncharacterized membrane protein
MTCRFVLASLAATALALLAAATQAQQAKAETIPRFQPEPFWPKPLPGNWVLGQVSGIAVDRQDNIWIVHRPASCLTMRKAPRKIRLRPSAARPRRRC